MGGVVTPRRIVVAIVLDVVLIGLSVVAVVTDPSSLRFVAWLFLVLGVLSGVGIARAWLRHRRHRSP